MLSVIVTFGGGGSPGAITPMHYCCTAFGYPVIERHILIIGMTFGGGGGGGGTYVTSL